jgi:hypothetical protein
VIEHIYKCAFVGSLCKYVTHLNARTWNMKCPGSTNVGITVSSVVGWLQKCCEKCVLTKRDGERKGND